MKKNHKLLEIMLISCALFMVSINFLMPDLTKILQIFGILFSLAITAWTVILSIYAVGFTTIRTSLVAMCAIAALLAVWIDNGPQKFRFSFSRSELVSNVENLKKGESVQAPMWVGLYHIKEIKRTNSGEIRFWTSLDPSGNTGIVFSPNQKPELNEMARFDLDENWYLISVD